MSKAIPKGLQHEHVLSALRDLDAGTEHPFVVDRIPVSWMLLAHGDARLYSGNIGYQDDISSVYRYDSFVANHKQLTVGDKVVLASPQGAAGFAQIERIEAATGEKELFRCPECLSTQVKRRKRKKPDYRCGHAGCGHEFDRNQGISEHAPCTKFEAHFQDTFVAPSGQIPMPELRSACGARYNGQLSIQRIDFELIRSLIEEQASDALWVLGDETDIPEQRAWAFLANPRHYRIDEAVREVSEDLWKVPRGDVRQGDRVAIWRAAGGQGNRGIIAIATVLTDPELLNHPEHLRRFWVRRPPTEPQRCVWVRYHQPDGLPLWLHEDETGLLNELSVSRARGGSVFRVSTDHWSRLEALADLRPPPHEDVPPDFDEAAEGRVLIRKHKTRERNRRVVKLKKEQALREGGNFGCEVCGFEFVKAYGTDYIECHHIVPLSALESPTTPRLEDLCLVCANCHRMLHTGGDGDNLDIDGLRSRTRVQYVYGERKGEG